MKLTMEFEELDLREMLTEYFQQRNFTVLNTNDLVDNFQQMFPNGLKVQVEIAQPTVTASDPHPHPVAAPSVSPTVKKPVTPTPVLSASDLTGATEERLAPSREDLLKEDPSAYDVVDEEASLLDVLSVSKKIEHGE